VIAFLFRSFAYLASAAIGLLLADGLLDGFVIQWDRWWGFVACIVIFAVLQSVLSPVAVRLADRYAPVLMGGIGIVSTLVALFVVVLLPVGGLRIVDLSSWVLGAVLVWLVTAIGSAVLPLLFLRRDPRDGGRGVRSSTRAR